jgi:hypothetical protein
VGRWALLSGFTEAREAGFVDDEDLLLLGRVVRSTVGSHPVSEVADWLVDDLWRGGA